MVYLTDSLEPFFVHGDRPIIESEMVGYKEVKEFIKLLYDLNKSLLWQWFTVENCIQTNRAAKEFSKILRRKIATNKDCKPKLEEGDVIIHLMFFASKPIFYIRKVTMIE